jgi:predicted phosphodiesterase
MSNLRYVCLSDLHLGAGYSVLTGVDADGSLTKTPSETLTALGDSLSEYIAELDSREPPTLVLLGDILDLTFSSTAETVDTLIHFIRALFPPPNKPSLLAKDILFVPGNHDHHIWQTVRDWYYIKHQLTTSPVQAGPQAIIPHPIEVTPLFNPNVTSELLNELIRIYLGRDDIEVTIAYPNYGDANDERCLLLSHGHYIDSVYRTMTSLNHWIWPDLVPDNLEEYEEADLSWIADIERQNGTWVDFIWSGLGNTGLSRRTANELYSLMQDPGASHRFSRRIASKLLEFLAEHLPVSPGAEFVEGVTAEHLARAGVDVTIGRAAEMERYQFLNVMSDSSLEGLAWYLSGPLLQQVRRDDPELQLDSRDVTFVFGHTHKPFEDRMVVPNYKRVVNVFNTGGWVLDQPKMTPLQGAAAVFVDEELNVGSLRLFNDPVNDIPVHVSVQTTTDTPLSDDMVSALAATQASWKNFTQTAFGDITLRAKLKREKFFDPTKSPGIVDGETG